MGARVITYTGSELSVPVSYAAWRFADFPAFRALPSLPGDRVCRIPGSPQLLYFSAGLLNTYGSGRPGHPLTYDQWAASGYLAPSC